MGYSASSLSSLASRKRTLHMTAAGIAGVIVYNCVSLFEVAGGAVGVEKPVAELHAAGEVIQVIHPFIR